MQTPSSVATDRTLIRPRLLLFTLFWLLSVAPFFLLHQQFITGPLVNAILILSCVLLGPAEAIVIGLFPSAIALMNGLLPPAFAPMVPLIMIGNAVYVGVFHFGRKATMPRSPKSPTNQGSLDLLVSLASLDSFSLILASLLKFAFLALTARWIVSAFVPPTLKATLTLMMGWPQLITALIGGAIALGILFPFRTINNR